MTGNSIATVVAIALALVLAFRGLQGRKIPPRRLLMMGGAWIIVIAVVVWLIDRIGLVPTQ